MLQRSLQANLARSSIYTIYEPLIVSKVSDYFYSWNVFTSDREDTIAFYETDNLRKEDGSSLKTKNIPLGFLIKAS